MEFDAVVVGAGEAAAAQAAGGHVEIPAIFLNHDVGSDFGGAEERVLGLIDGESLGDAVLDRRGRHSPSGWGVRAERMRLGASP